MKEMSDVFDVEPDEEMGPFCRRSFLSDYGIDLDDWFDYIFHYFQYEKVCQDSDSPKEAARKEKYPMMTDTETLLILALKQLDDDMVEARQYYFEKQWQHLAMKYRRLDGSLVN